MTISIRKDISFEEAAKVDVSAWLAMLVKKEMENGQ